VPSTHNKEDFEKFRLAKERTKKLYQSTFGDQPPDIWEFAGMYESLQLEKSNIKIRTFILFGILSFVVLVLPAYYSLKPLYIQIGNPDFVFYYITLAVIAFLALNIYNKRQLSKIVEGIHPSSFLFDLQPMEIVYLKTQKLYRVIDGTLNQLIVNKKVVVSDEVMLKFVEGSEPVTIEEYQILDALKGTKQVPYESLVRILEFKPVFSNTSNALYAVKKYFIKSKRFGELFCINFSVLSFVLLLGFIRLLTGIFRDKPISQITLILFLLTIIIVLFLYRLSRHVVLQIVPKYYKRKVSELKKASSDWEWDYAFHGTSVLTPALIGLASYNGRHNGDGSSSSSSDSSSSDSSCGSSCSSCGGCGGD
jgi:hypothetical protein